MHITLEVNTDPKRKRKRCTLLLQQEGTLLLLLPIFVLISPGVRVLLFPWRAGWLTV